MGRIQINTRSGPILVNIAGDTPTNEEKKYIMDNLSTIIEDSPQAAISPQKEDISNYYRRLFAEKEKEPIKDEPKEPEIKIDVSGVKDIGLRADLAQAENDEEYKLRLNRAGFSDDQFFKDPKKGYVLELDKIDYETKKRYNLPNSGNLSIEDEEKFTKQDFVEFFSQARGPLVGGIAASLAASGYGLPLAALVVGGGSALGYLFDEGLEYSQKVQAQDSRSVRNTALFEAIAGVAGEGAGRFINSALSRFLKGPGGPEANEARALMRKAISEGARPTVRGANTSPILGRLQAIYEGVLPNTAMANKNAQFIVKELKKISPKQVDTKQVLNALEEDIKRIYSSPKELMDQANKNMKNLLDKEIDKLIKMFGEPEPRGASIVAKNIELAKRTFDEDSNALYKKANELLEGRQIIDVTNFKATFNKLADKQRALQLREKGLGQVINKLENPVDVETMQSIRTALRHASFDKDLVGTQEDGILNVLSKAIDDAFIESEAKAKELLRTGRDPITGRIISKIEKKKISDGFDYLREAGDFYKEGVSKFRQKNAKELFQKYKEQINFNPEELYDPKFGLIVPGSGLELENFLKTVVPSSKDSLPIPKNYLDVVPDIKVDKTTLKEIVEKLPENDPLKNHYKKSFENTLEFAEEVRVARQNLDSASESVREVMASTYLNRLFRQKDAFGNINAAKVSEDIYALGQTGKILFGKDYNNTVKVLQDMQSMGKRISEADLAAMSNRPLTEQILEINRLAGEQKNLSKLNVIQGIERAIAQQDPDLVVDAVFRKNGANAIRIAKEKLGKNSASMEQVKDLSMARMLASMGEPDATSAEFVEAVFSGKAAGRLRSKLDSYGRDTLNEMFGKEVVDGLYDFSRVGTLISQEPIKGLGALAPATIATSLGIVGIIMDPLTTLSTFGGIYVMSKLLRTKSFLNLVTRPTGVRPGQGEYDKIGRGLEMVYEAIGQASAAGVTTTDQPPTPKPSLTTPEGIEQRMTGTFDQMQDVVNQVPNVMPPAPGTSASMINPITIPDPATLALAQQLQNRKGQP
tara:strand:- start:957 stop:4079 length:3123 start_codon:yes stop_codon:yes gene_type:complete